MDSRWGKASPRQKWRSVSRESANVPEGPLPAELLFAPSSLLQAPDFLSLQCMLLSSSHLLGSIFHLYEGSFHMNWKSGLIDFVCLVFSVLPIPKVTVMCSVFCHCWEIPSTIALFKFCFVWFPLRFSISCFCSLTWRIHKVWNSFNLSWMRIQVILIFVD